MLINLCIVFHNRLLIAGMRDAKLPARAVACEVEGESLWGPKGPRGHSSF